MNPPQVYLFLKQFLIGGELLYNAVLVSAVQQHKTAIIIHIYHLLLEPPSPLVITERHAGLPVLHGTFSPAVCFTR